MSCQLDAPSMELDYDASLPHEATGALKESSTSSVHSEPANVQETDLPTEHDSVSPCYRPKCDAIPPLTASATQRMKCGGSAIHKPTHDAFSPSDPPNLTPGIGLRGPHLLERSYTCQCLQTNVFEFLVPCHAAADRISNGHVSGSKGHVSSTSPSLESLKRETDLLQITFWILGSDFLRLRLVEPIIGDAPIIYPSIIDDYGLKGQSIYTAFFDHLDMETFVCWKCGHTVEEDLEVAIAHQRGEHFLHEPYRCNALNGQCTHRFASQGMLHAHQVSAGH